MPTHRPPILFKNCKPAFAWGIALFCVFVAAAMTFLFLTKGPPDGYTPQTMTTILAVIWVFLLGGTSYAFSQPCTLLTVPQCKTIRVVLLYPFGRQVHHFLKSETKPALLVETKDSEGDPYYKAAFTLPGRDPLTIVLFESHDKQTCQDKCNQFNALLSK
jgi:hypothetical protein